MADPPRRPARDDEEERPTPPKPGTSIWDRWDDTAGIIIRRDPNEPPPPPLTKEERKLYRLE